MNVDSMFLVKVFPSLLIYVATRAAFTADYVGGMLSCVSTEKDMKQVFCTWRRINLDSGLSQNSLIFIAVPRAKSQQRKEHFDSGRFAPRKVEQQSVEEHYTELKMETPPEWDMLLSAAQKNRPELIAEMIDIGGVNPSHSNAVGQTALHIAALWGHHESVEALATRGANVNAQNDMSGASPLHMVAQSLKSTLERRLRCAEVLIAHGARVDQTDHNGMMPLHILQRVLGDQPSEDEATQRMIATFQPTRPAIHDALVERNVAKLTEILGNDASLSNLTYQGDSPVEIAVDALIQQELNDGDEVRDNAEGDVIVKIIELLLKHGGHANGSGSITKTMLTDPGNIKEAPLHRLVCALRESFNTSRETNEETSTSACLETAIDLLVEAGAKLSPDTTLLLHQAARRDEVAFARYLIERLHVDVNLKGRQGMTPLQFAARSGKTEMVVSLNPTKVKG